MSTKEYSGFFYFAWILSIYKSKKAWFLLLLTATVLNKKIWEVEDKIADTSGLATAAVLNTKFGKV